MSTLQRQLWFTAGVLRAGVGRVPSWPLFWVQAVGTLLLCSLLLGPRGLGTGNSWQESVQFAFGGWVPYLLGLVTGAGLSQLVDRPAISLLPGLTALGRRTGLLLLLAAALVGGLVAAWRPIHPPYALAICAAGAFTLGLMTRIWAGGRGSAIAMLAGLVQTAWVSSYVERLEQPLGWPTALVLVALSLSLASFFSKWPTRSVHVGRHSAADSIRFPAEGSSRGTASGLERLRSGDRVRRSAFGAGSPFKLLVIGLILTVVPGFFLVTLKLVMMGSGDEGLSFSEQLYRMLLSDESGPAKWSDANLLPMSLLLLVPILATSQHSVLGPVPFSRRTLARFATRKFLRDASLFTGLVIWANLMVVGGVLLAVDRGWPSHVPYIFHALLLVVALLPWLAACALYFQRRSLGAMEAETAAFLRQNLGILVAMTLGLMLYQLGVRHLIVNVLLDASFLRLLAPSAAVMAVGLAVLPLAYRRYYDRASLEP